MKLIFPFNLGGSDDNVDDIKRDKFFRGIDWNKVARKQVKAPFKPKIRHPNDVSNFAEDFTDMEPIDEPADPPPNHERLFRG